MKTRQIGSALIVGVGMLLATSCASSSSPPINGCAKTPSKELFQNGMYSCPDGVTVYTFTTEAARDQWIEIATQFGAEVLGKGATWVKVKEAG